ncbi:MAG: pyrroline-5-carboxylate reductase [Patescibacteria group bacterium]|nr:pyrroline-5-carboxylate reductase [Patescibacteria group bacterium]
MKKTIAIIGTGNMGQAIAQGLLNKRMVTQDQLILTNSKTQNNKKAVAKADIVILAIKPQMASVVMSEIKNEVKEQLLISIMAGITIDAIQQAFGRKVAVVRVMPNLGAKVGKSMSVWVKSKEVAEMHESIVKAILGAIGIQLELQKEEQINIATAISGSGPAYFFYLTELIENAAENLGLTHGEAAMLVKQTLLGSAELLKLSNQSAGELRHAVTSKGGTTEAAIDTFQKAGLEGTIEKGIFAACDKANKLSKMTDSFTNRGRNS